MTSAVVLQTLHNLSDREAAEALRYDLRWKAACGFALTETSFHPTVLVYWRKRLSLDSTILEDAVARQDILTQLIAQIRRVGREVPGVTCELPRISRTVGPLKMRVH